MPGTPSSRVPVPPAEGRLVPRLTKPELQALARDAYASGDPGKLAELGALPPEDKAYLATHKDFQAYIVALMFDAVIGNERVTKGQRSAAAWFYRVIAESNGKGTPKAGRIPEGAIVVDAGGDDE